MKIETILVPIDFSPHADNAFAYALELAGMFGAAIEVLHLYDLMGWVGPYEITFSDRIEAEIRATADKKLAPLIKRARAAGVAIETHVVLGSPSVAISERASAIAADLIVMGTRGLGAAKRVFLGSVASRTVRDAPCPVLTVGPNVRPTPESTAANETVATV